MAHAKETRRNEIVSAFITRIKVFIYGFCAMSLLAGGMSAHAQQKNLLPLNRLQGLKATLAARGFTSLSQAQNEALEVIASAKPRASLTQNQIDGLKALGKPL